MKRKTATQLASEAFWNQFNTQDVNTELIEAKKHAPPIRYSSNIDDLARSLSTIQKPQAPVEENDMLWRIRSVFFEGEFYTVDILKDFVDGTIKYKSTYFGHIIPKKEGCIIPDVPLLCSTLQRLYEVKDHSDPAKKLCIDLKSEIHSGIITNTAYEAINDVTINHYAHTKPKMEFLDIRQPFKKEILGDVITQDAYDHFFDSLIYDFDYISWPDANVKTNRRGFTLVYSPHGYDNLLAFKLTKE